MGIRSLFASVVMLGLFGVAQGAPVGSSDYAQGGLILQYDGIENVGRGQHDGATRTWKNLVADKNHLALPDYIAASGDNAFLASCEKYVAGAQPTLDAADVIGAGCSEVTVEMVVERGAWSASIDSSLQTLVWTPFGGFCMRKRDGANTDLLASWSADGVKIDHTGYWTSSTASSVHTYALAMRGGGFKFSEDGAAFGADVPNQWGVDLGSVPTTCTLLKTAKVDVRVFAIRVYCRRLTAAELARNAQLDRCRFLGESEQAFHVDIPAAPLTMGEPALAVPIVSNLFTGVELTAGTDYDVTCVNNRWLGTATATVVGKGDYEGFSVTKDYDVISSLTAKMSFTDTGVAVADLAFPAENRMRKLYLAYAKRDAGDLADGWENVVELCEVAAGETEKRNVELPESIGTDFTAIRFFLETDAASAFLYAQDGLVLHYDGIENAGAGVHDASARVWKNLVADKNHLTLPGAVTARSDNSFFISAVDYVSEQLPSLPASDVIGSGVTTVTVEYLARKDSWKSGANQSGIQTVASTPFGYMGYRATYAMISYLTSGNPVAWGHHFDTGNFSGLHTYAAALRVGGLLYGVDGGALSAVSMDWTYNLGNPATAFKFFNCSQTDASVYAIRIYDHQLTNAEVARNRRLDLLRFREGGVQMPSDAISCRRPILAKLDLNIRDLTADVYFASSAVGRNLYVAWGRTDGGVTREGWGENVAFVGCVPAGATSLLGVALPENAISKKGRFFFDCCSTSYAVEGLVLNYDGIDNAGVNAHDGETRTWKNLGSTGAAYDLSLPDFVTVADGQSFLSKSSLAKTSADYPRFAEVTGVDTTQVATVEVVMKNLGWVDKNNYNNTQSVFGTPMGGISYRLNNDGGFCVTFPKNDGTSDVCNWIHPTAKTADRHTIAATLGWSAKIGNNNAEYMDGVQGATLTSNYNGGPDTVFSFFSNKRADIQVYAIRLYNRKLTAEEISSNAEVDSCRFGGIEFSGAECSDLFEFPKSGLSVIVR